MILVDCNPEHGTRYPYMMVATCPGELAADAEHGAPHKMAGGAADAVKRPRV